MVCKPSISQNFDSSMNFLMKIVYKIWRKSHSVEYMFLSRKSTNRFLAGTENCWEHWWAECWQMQSVVRYLWVEGVDPGTAVGGLTSIGRQPSAARRGSFSEEKVPAIPTRRHRRPIAGKTYQVIIKVGTSKSNLRFHEVAKQCFLAMAL